MSSMSMRYTRLLNKSCLILHFNTPTRLFIHAQCIFYVYIYIHRKRHDGRDFLYMAASILGYTLNNLPDDIRKLFIYRRTDILKYDIII